MESPLDSLTVEVEDVNEVPDFEDSFELGRVAVAAGGWLVRRDGKPQALAGRDGDAAGIVALASFWLVVVDFAPQILGERPGTQALLEHEPWIVWAGNAL